jgi:hypothetical protein
MPIQIIDKHPRLLDLLPTNQIPDSFFIKDEIENILSEIYYRKFSLESTRNRDYASYNLNLLFLNQVGFTIPSTEIKFLLNPATDGTSLTEVPISFEYHLPILRYRDLFSSDTFSEDPLAYFSLLLRMLNLPIDELLLELLNSFGTGQDQLQSFIDSVNANYNTGTTIVKNSSIAQDDILTLIEDMDERGLDIVSIIFQEFILSSGSLSNQLERLIDIFGRWIHNLDLKKLFLDLFIPSFSVSINSINVGLQFPRKWLTPIYTGSQDYPNALTDKPDIKIDDPLPEGYYSDLIFNVGALDFSTEKGFEFKDSGAISFKDSYIGNTGLRIGFSNVKLDLSTTTNIPEATADGRSNDFRGVYIDSATIGLPAKWFKQKNGASLGIYAEKLLVGTGGMSGKIGLKALGATNPAPVGSSLEFELGQNLTIGFKNFDVELAKGKITHTDIQGYIKVPIRGVVQTIDIEMSFDDNGDFRITASSKSGINLPFGDLFSFKFYSLEVGELRDKFYLALSGDLSFPETSLVNTTLGITKPIQIKKLVLWEDGHIELEGGAIPLPKSLTVKMGPTTISITGIYFGSHQEGDRKYNFWGFDGGVNVNPGGVDVKGKGIKYHYTIDDGQGKPHDSYISMESMAIDLIIPGKSKPKDATALIKGWLSVQGHEYAGGVDLTLPKVGISGGVDMKFDTKFPAWIVDAHLDFSVPIPLAATGLGIYGFRGLVGQRYVASKTAIWNAEADAENHSWFDYYKDKTNAPNTEGVNIGKFRKPLQTDKSQNPFSVGAGITLATTMKDGEPFSMKLFLLLSLPSLVYLEGKANILGPRLGLDKGDAPFFAYVAFEPHKSLETGFGANYQLGDNGSLLDIQAEIQAGYFFDNPSAWYLNFGTKDKPITAGVLSLFTAKTYLMINRAGIDTMARIDWGFDKQYLKGKLKAKAYVYIEVGGHISFLHPQIGAYAKVGGGCAVSIWGCGFHLSLDTTLAVEAPKPFYIAGSAELCVGVKILWKHFDACFTVEFKWEKAAKPTPQRIFPLPVDKGADALREVAKAVNIQSNEIFPLVVSLNVPSADINLDEAIIPLDSFIDVQFQKGMLPSADFDTVIGRLKEAQTADYTETLPPKPVNFEEKHQYGVESIQVKILNKLGGWESYDPYKAMATPEALAIYEPQKANYKLGYWQLKGSALDNFRVLSQTPFSFTDKGLPGSFVPEKFGLTPGNLFCQTRTISKHCLGWENVATDTTYQNYVEKDGVVFYSQNEAKVIAFSNVFNLSKSLTFKEGVFEIQFKAPVSYAELRLFTYASGVEMYFYNVDELVEHRHIERMELINTIYYNPTTNQEITRIHIERTQANQVLVATLQNQVEALRREINEGDFTTLQKEEKRALIATKLEQINAELQVSCIDAPSDLLTGQAIDAVITNKVTETNVLIAEATSAIAALNTEYTNCKTTHKALEDKFNTCFKELCDYKLPPTALSCLREMSLLPPPNGASDAAYDTFMTDVKKFIDDIHLASIQYYIDLKKVCRDLKHYIQEAKKECETIRVSILGKEAELAKYQKTLSELNEYIAAHTGIGYIRPDGYGHCGTYVHQVCWLTKQEHAFNQTITPQEAIQEQYEAMVKGLEHTLSPIWRPDSKYYMELTISDTVNNQKSEVKVYYAFKTAGPLGYWHKNELVETRYIQPTANELKDKDENGNEITLQKGTFKYRQRLNLLAERKQLTSLKTYIDYGKSYPNADGNIVNAKPLFYKEPTLYLYYNARYVYHFFNDWPAFAGYPAQKGSLQVLVKDPVEDVAFINPPTPEIIKTTDPAVMLPYVDGVQWEKDGTKYIYNSVDTVNNLANPIFQDPAFTGTTCIQTGGVPIQPARLKTTIIPRYLKPLKMYTAMFNNVYKDQVEEVHRYGFQTSRYGTFEEQINSYLLEDKDLNQKEAIFQLDLPQSADSARVALAHKISARQSATGDTTYQEITEKYADAFEQLVYGALGFAPLETAISTEFNIVRDAQKNILGIWIRNPEPFNDPKLPRGSEAGTIDQVQDTLKIVGQTGFNFLWSKDLSQVFVMRNTGNILDARVYYTHPNPPFEMRFTFTYKVWNGEGYSRKEVTTKNVRLATNAFKTFKENNLPFGSTTPFKPEID